MDRYQNIEVVAETTYAEMERPDRFADLSDAAGADEDQAATTSVEELLEILAELSERVTRLERAMVMLLENRDGVSTEPVVAPDMEAYLVDESEPEPEPEPEPVPPPRSYRPAPRPAPRTASASLTDTLSVAVDLPSHQWGAEGLTEAARKAGPITPIQHSDYPEINAPAEEAPKPKRTGPPERVTTRAALESYPHIVESVCLMWGGREADDYLSKLVIDTRGGRRGFPRDVMEELLVLVEVSTIKSGLKPDFTPFDRDRSRERER